MCSEFSGPARVGSSIPVLKVFAQHRAASAALRQNTWTAVSCTESVRKQNSKSRLRDSRLANFAKGRCSRSDLEFRSSHTRSCSSCPKLRFGAYAFAACWIHLVEQALPNQMGLPRSPAKCEGRTAAQEKESYLNTPFCYLCPGQSPVKIGYVRPSRESQIKIAQVMLTSLYGLFSGQSIHSRFSASRTSMGF